MGFAGPTGAGKTTGATYLAAAYGFQYVRYSQVLARWFNEDENAKDTLQARGWEVMSSGMQDELNHRVIQEIRSQDNCAVDGLRHDIDQRSLKAAFGSEFFLIYVEAPEQLRWQRAVDAGRFNSREPFRNADRHPVEQPLRTLRAQSLSVIQNAGSLASYHEALDLAIRRIRMTSIGGAP